jgi:hypothetical protein
MSRKLLFVALALASLTSFVPSASAATGKFESHCVVRVTGQKESGELITDEPKCYARFSDAMRATGVEGATTLRAGASSREIQAVNSASTSSYVLATHYDGAGFTGSSTSTVGNDCLGGWLNTSASWSNRISSTSNGLCNRTRHYDYPNLGGGSEDVYGSGGNLWAYNNATESIQYLN